MLVGVLNGVFLFFAELVKNLSVPARIDFIRLASYGSGTETSGKVLMTKDVEYDLNGRDALIVEDIVDSGLTLNWLRKHLTDLGACSVRTAALINKLERRNIPVEVDFIGFTSESGFLVGYGMDFDGRYRGLPAIYDLIQN